MIISDNKIFASIDLFSFFDFDIFVRFVRW